MRAIHTYAGCTKVTTNDWDIRPSVAVKALSTNTLWMAKQICMIELVLESTHQFTSIIPVDTTHHLLSLSPYTEPLKHH